MDYKYMLNIEIGKKDKIPLTVIQKFIEINCEERSKIWKENKKFEIYYYDKRLPLTEKQLKKWKNNHKRYKELEKEAEEISKFIPDDLKPNTY